MKNLLELAALREKMDASELPNDTILIYGESKSGKTEYAATLAESDAYDKVYWYDGENGSETIIRMAAEGRLSAKAAAKIILIKVVDTPNAPYFQETMLKVYCVNKTHKICEKHGRSDCPICTKEGITEGWMEFNLYKLGKRDLVVTDSGSQFATSIMAYLCKGKELAFKPGWDEYGPQGRMLADALSVVQAATTNHVWITHVLIADDTEDINKDEKQVKDKFYPLVGTKNFSASVAKYFGTVVFLKKRLGKHMGGSGSTFMLETLCGSRIGMKVEDDVGLKSLADMLKKAKAVKSASVAATK